MRSMSDTTREHRLVDQTLSSEAVRTITNTIETKSLVLTPDSPQAEVHLSDTIIKASLDTSIPGTKIVSVTAKILSTDSTITTVTPAIKTNLDGSKTVSVTAHLDSLDSNSTSNSSSNTINNKDIVKTRTIITQ